MRNRVAVLHGVNLSALDRRPAQHYGGLTFTELENRIAPFAREVGVGTIFFHPNPEGEYVEELHKSPDYSDGLVLNPGAWTHYSWAVRDALEIAGLPAVEVHLSHGDAREKFRKISVVRDHCLATFKGRGVDGYREALVTFRDALA